VATKAKLAAAATVRTTVASANGRLGADQLRHGLDDPLAWIAHSATR
jgi:hypothetical protein